jgi:hypothetical protein
VAIENPILIFFPPAGAFATFDVEGADEQPAIRIAVRMTPHSIDLISLIFLFVEPIKAKLIPIGNNAAFRAIQVANVRRKTQKFFKIPDKQK